MSKLSDHLFLIALVASLGACAGESAAPGPTTREVSQIVTIEEPTGARHDARLELTIEGATSAVGTVEFLDERFSIHYWRSDESAFLLQNERSGATLSTRTRGADVELTFDVDGDVRVFRDQAGLATLDLARLPEHAKLLFAAQVTDDVQLLVDPNEAYFPWLLVGIAVLVVGDACSGTELTCNGEVTVVCWDGSSYKDTCGCGESICNKCWPSTCADECSQYDGCPPRPETADPVTGAGEPK